MSNLKQKVKELRNNKLGVKFARQKPILLTIDNKKKLFIAVFYCSKAKLAIELDGEIHNQQKDYDNTRDQMINLLGIKVLRFNKNK